jgi:putative ABC transport system permease protein
VNYVTIVRRNLRHRIARNVALIFSVALVASLTTVFVAGRTFFRTGDVLLERPLIVVDPIYPYGAWLRDADSPKIKALPNVVSVSRAQTYEGRNSDSTFDYAAFGADDTYFTVFNADGLWFPTTPDMVDRWRKDRIAFIVGETTAQKLGFQVGHQYELLTGAGKLMGNCVGIARGGANKVNLVLHYEYVDEALGKHQGRITRWLVEVANRDQVNSTIDAINALFKDSATPTASIPAGDHVRALSSKKRSIVNLLGIVCVLILFVTMFITLNTVLFLVRERRQVLAELRAIGFLSRHVFWLVVAEVITLCMIGGVLGVGLVLLVFPGGIPFGEGSLLVSLNATSAGAGLGVAFLISIVASVIPSWMASRANLIEALRTG